MLSVGCVGTIHTLVERPEFHVRYIPERCVWAEETERKRENGEREREKETKDVKINNQRKSKE